MLNWVLENHYVFLFFEYAVRHFIDKQRMIEPLTSTCA